MTKATLKLLLFIDVTTKHRTAKWLLAVPYLIWISVASSTSALCNTHKRSLTVKNTQSQKRIQLNKKTGLTCILRVCTSPRKLTTQGNFSFFLCRLLTIIINKNYCKSRSDPVHVFIGLIHQKSLLLLIDFLN